MERVNYSYRLGNHILFWMSVLVSVEVVVNLAIYSLGMIVHSWSYFSGLMICSSVFWICFFLHKHRLFSNAHSTHFIAFLSLILLVFLGLNVPFDFRDFWIVFLLYPIIVSLFQHRTGFFLWSSVSYLLFGICMYAYSDNTISMNMFHRCVLAGGSFVLACLVYATLNHIKKSFRQAAEDRKRESTIALLHRFVPIVERKSQTSSREIDQMARLIKSMVKQFPEEHIRDWEIKVISLLHFVSRINWPDYIFEKNEKLTDYEYLIVQNHCSIARDFFQDDSAFHQVVNALLHHHERFDGTGYPNKLKGEQIPLLSQFVGISESIIAMTTTRAYREAISYDEAFSEISSLAGSAYDKRVVEALRKTLAIPAFAESATEGSNLVG